MRKLFILISVFIIPLIAISQTTDSTKFSFREFKVTPRVGISYQKNLFTEFGISFNEYSVGFCKTGKYSNYRMGLFGAYLSSEILIQTEKTIIGPKIGFEFAGIGATAGGAYGVEFTYYSDFDKSSFALTPKAGIPLGIFEIYYGYSFFSNKDLKHYIGNHRFGISMNINRLYWKKRKEMMKEYRDYMESQK
ncbi:MAG: hypothetical protein WCK02_17175 [Bacteroidota bacterium]